MKNLKKFGVQELNAKEIKETEGGWIDKAVYGILALTIAVLNTDWDAAADDFNRGFADAH